MIRLISIHIPKTAGKSFRAMLGEIYGEQKIFHASSRTGKTWNDDLKAKIPPEALVFHGHVTYRDIVRLQRETGAPVVTWVRNPVERVISNYCYFIERARSGARPHVAHRKDETLEEYAGSDVNRNRIARFLDGARLADLFFVGIVEHFPEDIEDLGRLLGWRKKAQVPRLHDNSEFKRRIGPVGEKMRRRIRELNQEDEKLYEEALQLRKKRPERLLAMPDKIGLA